MANVGAPVRASRAAAGHLVRVDGGPMIYICFGMLKSASTFLYQLTEETFRAAGRRPVRLGPPVCPRWSVENYVDDIEPAILDALSATIGERDVVLKTHQGLHPEVARRIEEGSALASASIRDPREIALAMVDHGRRSRRRGDPQFSECHAVFDTFSSLDDQAANLARWSALGGIEVFRYNEICFDSAAVVGRIAAQIGLAVDAAEVSRRFRDRGYIGQFNKGAALRYREMAPDHQSAFLQRYAKLYGAFGFDTPAAEAIARAQEAHPPRARPGFAHHVTFIRRLLRS